MYYNIDQALQILPVFCAGGLILLLAVQEIRTFLEFQTFHPADARGQNGFIPPDGDGYEYYVAPGTVVFLHPLNRSEYRVYLVRGEPPAPARLKQDKYGRYFLVRGNSPSQAEAVVDQSYGR